MKMKPFELTSAMWEEYWGKNSVFNSFAKALFGLPFVVFMAMFAVLELVVWVGSKLLINQSKKYE